MSAHGGSSRIGQRQEGFPFSFRCRRSGNCCARPAGVVRIDAAEVPAMARARGLSEAGFRSRFVAPGGDRLVAGLAGRCPLLDDGAEASCSVYRARPAQCRSWPFWPELRSDPEQLRAAARFCPGIELD